jgi:hypothetical protein
MKKVFNKIRDVVRLVNTSAPRGTKCLLGVDNSVAGVTRDVAASSPLFLKLSWPLRQCYLGRCEFARHHEGVLD